MRKFIVSGSRRFDDQEFMEFAFDTYFADDERDVLLIHGNCRGADVLAAYIAARLGWWTATCPADWSIGKAAGVIRNQKMLDVFEPDFMVAFPLQGSRGTWDAVRRAESMGIEAFIWTMPSV